VIYFHLSNSRTLSHPCKLPDDEEMQKYLILITSLICAILILSGCTNNAYTRKCDWCDSASQEQLKRDVTECNASAQRQFPNRTSTRRTGRIVTSYGSTTCKMDKKGTTTCTRGNDYTYPEELTYDDTDYVRREASFNNCIDIAEKNYRPKHQKIEIAKAQEIAPKEVKHNWNLNTHPDDVLFSWKKLDTDSYVSISTNSIQVNKDFLVFWALLNTDPKDDSSIQSTIMQMEADCSTHRVRLLVGYVFPEAMGKGALIERISFSNDNPAAAWSDISSSDPLMLNVCVTTK
jgi:hypothetical protein